MRTLFGLLITLLSIFSSSAISSARADDASCPTIELDNRGQSADGFPVWNQGDVPACYTYSASFLASVWIDENWSRVNTSYANYTTQPRDNYNVITSDAAAYPRILDAENGRTCEAFNYIMKREQALSHDPTNPMYSAPTCSMWGIELNAAGTRKEQETPAAFETKMHALLTSSARPIPFGIEYCSSVFSNPSKDFITNRSFRPSLTYLNENASSENFSSDCGFHSAAVIGQKMRGGVCYFKVRNSWGRAGLFTRNVEHGNYWIPAEALSRNTLRVIELKRP